MTQEMNHETQQYKNKGSIINTVDNKYQTYLNL